MGGIDFLNNLFIVGPDGDRLPVIREQDGQRTPPTAAADDADFFKHFLRVFFRIVFLFQP